MIKIMSFKKVFVKSLIFLIVSLTLIFNIGLYYNNKEMLTHYQPYYFRSYAYAAAHHISPPTNNLVNLKKANSIPVLMYHGIANNPAETSTDVKTFKDQMFKLKSEGYQTVRIDEFYKYLQGEKDLPDKSFLLTFDDGRKDAYYPVQPILDELDYSAVMFVVTSTLDQKSSKFHLTRDEINRMIQSGRWDIQPHTHFGHGLIDVDQNGTQGHFYANKMWLNDSSRLENDDEYKTRIHDDLVKAKNELKDKFNIDSIGFAFPFGDYGQELNNYNNSINVLANEIKENYSIAFYQSDAAKGYSYNYPKNNYMVKRITVDSELNTDALLKTLNGGKEKENSFTFDNFKQDQGWIKTWGSVHYKEGHLILLSNEECNGSSVILDGTGNYKNFKVETSTNDAKGDSYTLMFRLKDANNFEYIEIFKDKLILGTTVNGISKNTYEKSISKINNISHHKFMYQISNNTLTVSIDNTNILNSHKLSNMERNGGIGFKVWDHRPDNAYMEIKELKVENL